MQEQGSMVLVEDLGMEQGQGLQKVLVVQELRVVREVLHIRGIL